ncbi:MAG: hypothetical protein RL705_1170 [Bacteroidota bacterium]|jgi:hypothetical protein
MTTGLFEKLLTKNPISVVNIRFITEFLSLKSYICCRGKKSKKLHGRKF